jgi:hypothetical protein
MSTLHGRKLLDVGPVKYRTFTSEVFCKESPVFLESRTNLEVDSLSLIAVSSVTMVHESLSVFI